eukprot:COSAG06_NODE_8582_length_2124_cov_1.443951_1_plen_93_part_00
MLRLRAVRLTSVIEPEVRFCGVLLPPLIVGDFKWSVRRHWSGRGSLKLKGETGGKALGGNGFPLRLRSARFVRTYGSFSTNGDFLPHHASAI